MKLVYLLSWQHDPFASLREAEPDVEFVRVATAQAAADALEDADVLVLGARFYPGVVAQAVKRSRRLKLIQSAAIGTDIFAAEGVPEHIRLANAAGLKGPTVAEHAFALLLALAHAVPRMLQHQRKSTWGAHDMRGGIGSLEGQILVSAGFGSIGQEVVRKANAFDMHTIAVNRTGKGPGLADELHPVSELGTLLPRADALVISLPLSPATEGLVGAEELAAMKRSALLVNVGRGPVLDQAALTAALANGRIRGAALDVFDTEPLPQDDPLWGLTNTIISPHVAGVGAASYKRFAGLVADNLKRLRRGAPLLNEVTLGPAIATGLVPVATAADVGPALRHQPPGGRA